VSNALPSDVQARAETHHRQTPDHQWQDLARSAWTRSRAAASAGNAAEALRWLHRAYRLLPDDGTIALALASASMQAGNLSEAADLFEEVGRRYVLSEAWAGLAACARLLGDTERSVLATTAALRASVPNPTLRALAAAVARTAGLPGWCGLDGDGRVHTGMARKVQLRLDGTTVRPAWSGGKAKLPTGWRAANVLDVDCDGTPCLGSPLGIAAIIAVEGVVEARECGLQGWAWHPADSERDPVLTIGGRAVTATALAADLVLDRPLARPRRFALPADSIAQDGATSVLTPAGRHLVGSPIDPAMETRTAAALARAVQFSMTAPPHAPILADAAVPRAVRPAARLRPVDVVVPAYRGRAQTLACLDSVLATVPRRTRVWVIDDASPEPDLVAALEALARQKRIRLVRLPENRGFPAAANAGLRACTPRDAVLLNSDTLVPPGWLDRLRAAAYAAPDVGTVTPLSNDATILSYPDRDGGNSIPDLAATVATDALAQQANADTIVDIPTGVGFCLYLRRDCLEETGLFREDCFAQGYGEENDLCLRARHLGWRSVAAMGVFVAHVGGQSFGAARHHLIRRNLVVLNRLHPGYDALIAAHIAADPLASARRRMDTLRWAVGRSRAGAAILVTHGGGGGVDRVVTERGAAHAAAGLRPIVLRPGAPGRNICRVETADVPYPNLAYAVPDELPELAKLLRPDRPRHLELHHLLGHNHEVLGLRRMLRLPVDLFVHDYAWFCPRIALVSTGRRYCGEPDVAGCEACVADLGSKLHEDIAVPALLARSAAELASARQVIAPSTDAATRIRRHFPGTAPVVRSLEDDAAPPTAPMPSDAVRRVCVVGAIGLEKGYEVLLDCARDARARSLPIEFVIVGYTADDKRMLDAGPVFITGEYAEADATALIQAQAAHLAFLPSVWPETWCFALSRAWEAGLAVAAFDLGAQAERIRRTGRGWLLPLGLSARLVNDALLKMQPPTPRPVFRPASSQPRLAPALAPSLSS
jgi:GT2 family glycosyltransferase